MKQQTQTSRLVRVVKNKWFLISLGLVILLSVGAWSFRNGSSSERIDLPGSQTSVYHIKTSFAEAYLVKGNKLILIESGLPDKVELLYKEMNNLGFKPEDIALNIITHGHADHAGNAGILQQTYGTAIAGGVHDLDKFQAGKTNLSKADKYGFAAYLFGPGSDLDYTPFTPDIIVKDSVIDLQPFGVDGKIIPVAGHTPGSIVVVVEDKYLFCGDLVRADLGHNGVPTEHWFQEDRARAKEELKKIMKAFPHLHIVFPGHNGRMSAADVNAYLAGI